MKIHLHCNGRVVRATLADTEAAIAFVAMLPLTVTMHDLFGREKFGALPRPVGHAEVQTRTYAIGDLICWSAGPDLAVLYRQDGLPLCGGFHLLGRIDEGVEAFAARGPLQITIDLAASARADDEAGALRSQPSPGRQESGGATPVLIQNR